MKTTNIKGIKTISKTAQKQITGGQRGNPWDNPIFCYKKCVNSGYPANVCAEICEL